MEINFLNDEFPTVIAEIGGNHNGDLELAQRMVDAAASAGAQVVKFQTYIAGSLISAEEAAFADFQREALSFDEFARLAVYCEDRGVTFLSTPFDEESADLLDSLGVPAFKIASGDLTHVALLRHVAQKHKPIVLSTGASTWEEIDMAVQVIRQTSDTELVLLHCIAAYPAPDSEANLRVIPEMKTRYGLMVGYSDHTLGIHLALGAVALGAQVIEKHFTVDQALPGGDNEMSILPQELGQLIEGSRRIWTGLGQASRRRTPTEAALLPALRRSVVTRHDIIPGTLISSADLTAVRPGTGIPASDVDRVVGRKARVTLQAFKPLQWSDLTEA